MPPGSGSRRGTCLSRSNFHVEIEHWFVKLLECKGTTWPAFCKHYDLDAQKVIRELSRSMDQFKTGNGRAPDLSIEILDLMREAWSIASLEYNATRLRSGHLLAALLSDRTLLLHARSASAELCKINGEQLVREISAIIAGSVEDGGEGVANVGPVRSGTTGCSQFQDAGSRSIHRQSH